MHLIRIIMLAANEYFKYHTGGYGSHGVRSVQAKKKLLIH